MCFFKAPSVPPPPPPVAKSRLPDGGDATVAAKTRLSDKLKSGTQTILTQLGKVGGGGTASTTAGTLLGATGAS